MPSSCTKKGISIIKRNNIKKNSDFYCLSCLHSFRTKNKLESHKKVSENKDFRNVIMPSEDTEILDLTNIKNLIKHHLSLKQFLNA